MFESKNDKTQINMLELNHGYTAQELAENLFEVSYGTFRNNKGKYLDQLSNCYE